MRTSTVLAISAAARLGLVVWGEVQDRVLHVPFTDVDYAVFTDAARFVADGHSPYLRSTYRYSPLLAYILLPNVWVTRVWGKLLFCALDVWVGAALARTVHELGGHDRAAMLAATAWLCNPYTATISARGSCDVLVVALLAAVLRLLLHGAATSAALIYGLAVHLRIYPIIYAPSILLFLAARSSARHAQRRAGKSGEGEGSKAVAAGLAWPQSWREAEDVGLHLALHGAIFGGLAGGLFMVLGAGFHRVYGQPFLKEAFLHHLTRKDPRHNFSPYWYDMYLTHYAAVPISVPTPSTAATAAPGGGSGGGSAPLDPVSALMEGLLNALGTAVTVLAQPEVLAFVPQAAVPCGLAASLHAQLPLCWLAQTLAFVALNKVCTAQYFVWWLWLVPLVLNDVARPVPRGLLAAGAVWVAAQLHWLGWAYLLEFKGWPVFLLVWLASLCFLASNVGLLTQLLVHVRPRPSFLHHSLAFRDGQQGRRPVPDASHAKSQTVDWSTQAAEPSVPMAALDRLKPSAAALRARGGRVVT